MVERWNRTIIEMVKCMMENMCVSNKFWDEAVFPKVNHLKVFGSITYAWIPENNQIRPKEQETNDQKVQGQSLSLLICGC
jgi:hypothetical protein